MVRKNMTNNQKIGLLKYQMDYAWTIVNESLKDLSSEEFWWKPTENSWTLREQEDQWILDYDKPFPLPKGPLTVAWLIIHLGTCKIMYFEYAFGNAKLQWDKLGIPNNLNDALSYLQESQQNLEEMFNDLTNDDLLTPRLTNWGEKWTTEKIIWTLIQHDIYHASQIQILRKIFRFS